MVSTVRGTRASGLAVPRLGDHRPYRSCVVAGLHGQQVYQVVGEGAGGLGESKVSRVWIKSARGQGEEAPVGHKDIDEAVATYEGSGACPARRPAAAPRCGEGPTMGVVPHRPRESLEEF